jgi:hypothetical protein
MEILIGMVLLLLAFAVLTARYGVDSRAGLRTAEQRLAANGFVWATQPYAQKRGCRPQAAPQRTAGGRDRFG